MSEMQPIFEIRFKDRHILLKHNIFSKLIPKNIFYILFVTKEKSSTFATEGHK